MRVGNAGGSLIVGEEAGNKGSSEAAYKSRHGPKNSFDKRHILLRNLAIMHPEMGEKDIKRACVFTEGLTRGNRERDFVGEAAASVLCDAVRANFEAGGGICISATLGASGLERCSLSLKDGIREEFEATFDGKSFRVYCGMNTIFIPEVYEFMLTGIYGSQKYSRVIKHRKGAIARYEGVLARLDLLSKFAYRKFTQLKELREGEAGSRKVQISPEEYRDDLLKLDYRKPENKSKASCVICAGANSERENGGMSVHHIVGKGGFRHIAPLMQEQGFFTNKQKSRGLANFDGNEIWTCRKCHDGIEGSVNYYVKSENPDSNIGELYVYDLFLVLSRKIAHYSLVDTKVPNLYLYYDAMAIEGIMALEAAFASGR